MSDVHQKTILLVEDEAILAMTGARTLKKFGYDVLTAHTGEKGIALAVGEEKIDLILMDINLGKGIDGPQAAQQILESRNIPIVFLTSHSEKEYVDRVKQITRYGYVIKNSGDFVLRASIEMAFELFDAHCKLEDELSERRRSEKALAESQALQTAIVDSTTDMIWAVDPVDFGLLTFNRSFSEYFFRHEGIRIVAGMTPGDLFPPGEYVTLWCEFYRRVLSEGPYTTNFFVPAGGKILRLSFNVFKRDNRELGISVFGKDITDQQNAEDALKKSEEKFAKTFKVTPEAITITSIEDGKFIDVNDAFVRITGYQREDVVGRTSSELGFWVESDQQQQYAETLLHGESLRDFSIQFKTRNGEIRDFLMSGGIIVLEGKKCSLSFILDITERKQAERALREKTEELERYFDSSRDLLCIADTRGYFHRLNPEWEKSLGYSLADLEGKRFLDFVHPEDLAATIAAVAQLQAQEAVLNFENRYRCKDGSYRWIEWRSMPVGKLIYAAAHDITERKRVEEASHKLEEEFRLVWENSADGMRLTNEEGNVLRVNEAFCRMVGKKRSEMEGKSLAVIYEEERREHVSRQHRERFTTRTVKTHVEREIMLWSGRKIWIEVSNSFLESEGQPSLLLGIFRDVTERKSAEEKISNLLREKELMLREVHHRIKNNMNTMGSLLSLQAGSIKNAEAVAGLKDAKERMRSMEILYDKLYRSENVREISLKPYLIALVDEIVGNFPNSAKVTIEKNIAEIILGATQLSPLGIIVNELLTNIMKYAFVGRDRGVITVSATAKDHMATIIVQDDGVGIPDTVDIGSPAGFGLQLVDMLTTQLDGSIRIERHKGTKFVLEFTV